MLKTFMEKQFDIVRRDVWDEAKKGNLGQALKNATTYALVLGISGASTDVVKDWLMGRDPHFSGTVVLENVLKTFAWSSYVRDKAAQGHPVEALIGTVLPPYKMMDDVIRRDPKAVRYVPIIGRLYYEWELGGQQENELRRAREGKKAGREVELSPAAEAYRDRKRELRRDRREREAR